MAVTLSRNLAVNLTAVDKTRGVFGKTEKNASRLGRSVAGLGATLGGVFAAGAIAQGIKGTITAASDLNETVNKSNVIFGRNARAMNRWAAGAAKSMGLSKNAALGAASSFGDMFQQIGFAGDQSAKMARSVVQLSADLGSFNNLPTADVSERIAAAFRGEFDSLQKVIPNINAARVQKVALAQSGKDNAKALTAQEKAQAVLSIVQKDGARAQGDFARTSGSLANQQKILNAQFENAKTRLGTVLLPIVTKFANFLTATVVPAVNRFVTQMQTGAGAGGRFVDFMTSLLAAAKGTATWITRNRDVLIPLVVAFGSAVILVKAINAAQRAWTAVMMAHAAATKAMTVAQRILNQVMNANPVLRIVSLLFLLVGALVVAYKRSETFRRIVDKAFTAVKNVVAAVVGWFTRSFVPFFTKTIPGAFRAVVSWVKRHWPLILSLLTGPVGAAAIFIIRNWEKIKDGAVRAFGAMMRFIRGIPGKIKDVFSGAARWLIGAGKDVIRGLWDGLKAIWKKVTDFIGGIADWIREHKGPIGLDRNLLRPHGRAVMDGFLKGLRERFGPVAGAVSGITGRVVDIVRRVAAQFGWAGGGQWGALSQLITHESGWRPTAQNPTSTAYGLFQFLDSTWGTVGGRKTPNPALQTLYGLRYIGQRYGDPAGAWSFWRRNNWYDRGGVATGAGLVAKRTLLPERVLSPRQTVAFERFVERMPPAAASARGGGLLRVVGGKVEFDPRQGEMWIRDLIVQEQHDEAAFRGR